MILSVELKQTGSTMAKQIPPSTTSAAPPWKPHHHQTTRLYHGCLRHQATKMLPPAGRIVHTVGQPDSDFGRGFYTTTLKRQAEDWAYSMHTRESALKRRRRDFDPVVIWIEVSRAALAKLDTLAFVR